jgi:hypothetical protein
MVPYKWGTRHEYDLALMFRGRELGDQSAMTKHVARAEMRGLSRRDFARAVGIGAGAIAAGAPPALLGEPGTAAAQTPADPNPLNFGRIFNNLPAFAEPTERVKAALRELGASGGIMDAHDDLSAGPVQLIVNPALSVNNPDNPTHTAGTTFVGQFIDHDITFDAATQLGVPAEPEATRNTRVPVLDLDSVYGGGPMVSPQLYDPNDAPKLRIESGGRFEDLPRNADDSAIIGDRRNDENIIIAGLHAAFILFHNNMVDLARAQGLVEPANAADAFRFARNETRWHYHSMILSQFLPQVIGDSRLDQIRRGRRFYRPPSGRAFMPVEFQTGSYRMGHSMVRPSYRVNFTGQPPDKPNSPVFFGFLFDPAQENVPDSDDLRGGSRAPRRYVGWPTFFDFGDGNFRNNKLIDTRLSTPLFHLPLFAIASGEPPTSLAERNLLRHLTWSLPSGQTLASVIGAQRLSVGQLKQTGLGDISTSFLTSTPMWFYVLHEAFVREGGHRLGPVGGTIVGEVLVGLLDADPGSLLNQRGWSPRIPVRTAGHVLMQDILDFAGVSGLR